MVHKSDSSDKGRKNKRKLAEPSQQNTDTLTEFPRYEESDSIGWDDPFACHLEELLSSNLLTLFLTAMKQLIDLGYTDDAILKAISGTSRIYCGGGSNDLVTNIVNNTLNVLKNGKDNENKDYVFEDLQQLVAYTLVEMVSLVKEVRPNLSTVEAMWRLLMCDLNVVQAFEVERLERLETDVSVKALDKTTEPLNFGNFPNFPNMKKGHTSDNCEITLSGNRGTVTCDGIKSASFTLVSEEKFISCRKVRTKKEIAMLRQKSCMEKIRTYSKGGSYKSAKFASVGSFLLEKRGKSSELVIGGRTSSSSSSSSTSKITAEFGMKVSLTDNKNSKIDSSSMVMVDAKGYITALPAATKKKTVPPIVSEPPPDYYAGIPYDKALGKYLPRDKKDELILKLVPRVEGLQSELQVWTDWANQKVKEATSRLLKDQPELKALRKEREEAKQFKKEKQLVEGSTSKTLSDLEQALKKTKIQFEEANETVRRLEVDQILLKKEMEAAKVKAAESAKSCREAKERGEKSVKETHSWEGQKILLQEELKGHRDKVVVLQKEVNIAKTRQNQIEANLKQEKTAKGRLISQATSIKKERKVVEALGKAEEERIKGKAETDVKYYKENIKRLEREISELKLKSEYSRIMALKKGGGNVEGTKREKIHGMTTKVKRERECVMCLSEEMSVIFLPCAHQVLCVKCNQLHEKEGMLDCPSCRAVIQRRIQARFARHG